MKAEITYKNTQYKGKFDKYRNAFVWKFLDIKDLRWKPVSNFGLRRTLNKIFSYG